ncbi:MAG: hypothetical protein LUQ69_09125, partial [Methanoregulaceae archaeon]|nr:hypothetical protein [Methanoregulaceae archaeon]
MKISLLFTLACATVVLLAVAGCTQSVQPTPAPTTVPATLPTQTPTAVLTTVPTTLVPLPTSTAPALPLPVSIRDTQLLFTISAPDRYTGTTIRVPTSDYNILFKTTIFNPGTTGANRTITNNSVTYIPLADSLTIFSYSSSLSVDQNIRNTIRDSGAVFKESTVTYNTITYTRFDAESDPYSGTKAGTVVFVASKASANERGFLPVMMYTMTPDDTLSQATYENMVQSFRYYTGRTIANAIGTE